MMAWSEIGRRLKISPQAAEQTCAHGLKKIQRRPRALIDLAVVAVLWDEARHQHGKEETNANCD